MFRLLRSLVTVVFLLAIFILTGCGPALFGRQVIELQMPRSEIRDVVREAALWSDGQPIFEWLDTNYAFADGLFHIEGEFRAPDDQLQHGFLDLAFSVQRGELKVSIVGHNIEGLQEDEVERVNVALAIELAQNIEDSLNQEVIEYRKVEPLASNILQISLTPNMDPDAMIAPLPSQ